MSSRKDLETSYEIIEDVSERWGILPNRQNILFDFFAEEIRISTETLYRCRWLAQKLEISYDELFETHPHNLRDIIWDVTWDSSETHVSKIECDFTAAHIIYAMSFVSQAVIGHPFTSFNYTEYIQILYPAFMERRKFLCDQENNRKIQVANLLSSRDERERSASLISTDVDVDYRQTRREEEDHEESETDDDESYGESMSLDSGETEETLPTEHLSYLPPIISNGYHLIIFG